MTTPAAYAVPQSQMGVAIETTRFTPVPPAFWLPYKNPKYKPDLTLINDESLQGSMVQIYNTVPGLRYDAHGWDSYPYLDTFPVLIRALLGSADTLTAAPANTTLAASAAAGATSVSSAASCAAGTWIVIGSGSTQETHQVQAVSGAGPFTLTLQQGGVGYPLVYAQSNGAAVTGLTGHKFSLLNNAGTGNQPPSVTLSDYDGEEWRQLAGAQLDKLTIKGLANGLLDYNCTWFANAATTPSTPTASFSSAQAVPGWTALITVGTTQIQYWVDWQLDLARGVKPIPALTGSQAYFMYFAGPLQATMKITVIEQSGAPELAQYLAATQQVFDITLYDKKSGYALDIHSTKAQFKTGELQRGSNPWVESVLDVQLLPTATDATAGGVSPLAMTVANAQTTTF